ncbi:hypothetical protein [Janibacter sp. YB324]|uniref:hypothetical protein n=1 Tax=Janibacter sp. YB324 TaxID=2761047 RepID=UPI001CB9BD67|nr:hypothetical protein [Janibacter sp. YB324]
MIIDPIVAMIVPLSSPSSTGLKFITCSAKGMSHRGLVTKLEIIIAKITAMTTRATHRPG